MSTWKLYKLCYYAQAWTLAWESRELFPEEFQAWANGPVCNDLFREHQGMYMISKDELRVGNESNLTDTDKENVDVIITDNGDREPYWLREQTHKEDPWVLARKGLPDNARSKNIITKESMGLYYGGL
jgi:uncharacterized phage-associated protein